jgi:hypothetical protein
MPCLTDSKSREILAAEPTRRLLISGDNYKYQEIDGFLRLSSRSRRNNDHARPSIPGLKEYPSSSTSTSSDVDSDDSHSIPLTSHQATLKSLEQYLSSNLSSVSSWLSLISHTLSSVPVTSKNSIRNRSEITLSILNRALSAHPANLTSVKLRLMYLKSGEEIWQESKLQAEWEDALKIDAADIWMEWLDWRIRRGKYGIDEVVENARKAFNALGDGQKSEMGKVRIFWRVAVAFQLAGSYSMVSDRNLDLNILSSGFVERAFAMFQAQAELSSLFLCQIVPR